MDLGYDFNYFIMDFIEKDLRNFSSDFASFLIEESIIRWPLNIDTIDLATVEETLYESRRFI